MIKILILLPIFYLIFSGLITFNTFSFVNNIGLKFGLIDKPNNRKLHKSPIVRLGGTNIFLGIILTIALNYLVYNFVPPYLEPTEQFNLIIFGSIFMFLIGLADDLKGLSPWSRLVGQTILASILWFKGLSIKELDFSIIGFNNLIINLNGFLSYGFTIIWLVGITNAFNWIDGLDGLAIGITAIASFCYLIIFFKISNLLLIAFTAIIIGTCIGFIKNNFYPAKIFMGDGGAYFLGFLLGSIAIYKINPISNASIFLPAVLILLLPLLDMSFVIFKRLLNKKSPFYPDKSHFHHHLLKIGFNHKQTVVLLYFLSVFFGILGLLLTRSDLIRI